MFHLGRTLQVGSPDGGTVREDESPGRDILCGHQAVPHPGPRLHGDGQAAARAGGAAAQPTLATNHPASKPDKLGF